MKFTKLLKVYAFVCAFVCATGAFAQNVGDVAKFDKNYYMLVNEFRTPEQNDVFNHNVNIMQRYAAALKDIENKYKAETDERKKEELKTKLDALEKEFKANDDAMKKNFAFASNRKYRMLFLSSNICTALAKEELSSLKTSEGVQMDPMKIIQKGGSNYYRLKNIEGAADNMQLQQSLNATLVHKTNVENLRAKIAKTIDATEQMKLTKQLSESEMAMKNHDSAMRKKYGIGANKNYIVEIGRSQLWLELTPQELALVQQQQRQNEKNKQQAPQEKKQ